MSMRRVEVVQVDGQVEFLLEHGLGGGADDQVDVAAGGGEDLQQPHGIGHAAGPGDGNDDVSLHNAFPRVRRRQIFCRYTACKSQGERVDCRPLPGRPPASARRIASPWGNWPTLAGR